MPPDLSDSRDGSGLKTLPGRRRRPAPHRLLGVPESVDDPVRVILAAHLRLRRLRRNMLYDPAGHAIRRARRIARAREALLTRMADTRSREDEGLRDV